MNSNFSYVFLLFIIMLQMNLGFMEETDLRVPTDVIVSPQNDASDTKDQVENIRKEINGDEKIPAATVQQLSETSDVRHEIEDAIEHNEYINGSPVPEDIDEKLHAKKDYNEHKFGFFTLGVPFEDPVIHDKFFDTENRKVLLRNGKIPHTWFNRHQSPDNEQPLVLREPKLYHVLHFPLWRALLRKPFSGK